MTKARGPALPPVALLSRWEGFCLPCGSEQRPLVLTWQGRRGLRAWLAGEGFTDGLLRLTCGCCGGVDVVGWEDEPALPGLHDQDERPVTTAAAPSPLPGLLAAGPQAPDPAPRLAREVHVADVMAELAALQDPPSGPPREAGDAGPALVTLDLDLELAPGPAAPVSAAVAPPAPARQTPLAPLAAVLPDLLALPDLVPLPALVPLPRAAEAPTAAPPAEAVVEAVVEVVVEVGVGPVTVVPPALPGGVYARHVAVPPARWVPAPRPSQHVEAGRAPFAVHRGSSTAPLGPDLLVLQAVRRPVAPPELVDLLISATEQASQQVRAGRAERRAAERAARRDRSRGTVVPSQRVDPDEALHLVG